MLVVSMDVPLGLCSTAIDCGLEVRTRRSPFPVNAQCANTADTAIGGLCTANTSANAVVPGSVKDLQRAVVEIQQLQINDGGTDGQVSTTSDNTLFGVQGIFIP